MRVDCVLDTEGLELDGQHGLGKHKNVDGDNKHVLMCSFVDNAGKQTNKPTGKQTNERSFRCVVPR